RRAERGYLRFRAQRPDRGGPASDAEKVRDLRLDRDDKGWVLEIHATGDVTMEQMAATARTDMFVEVCEESSPRGGRSLDPLPDPHWMAAVKTVEPLAADFGPGALVRRTGRFLGRTRRWTEVTGVSDNHLDLRIIDGPIRGT